MKINRFILPAIAVAMLGAFAPASYAADVSAQEQPPEAPAAPKVTRHWSLSIEASPEFFAIDQDPHDAVGASFSKKPANGLADYYGKVGLGYTFDNNFVLGGSFQGTVKKNRTTAGTYTSDTYSYQVESTLGYKAKFDAFTLTPSVGLGYVWGSTGIFGATAASKDNPAFYYVVSLAGDYKINKQFTWNVFNVRWRDAFNYTWQTPKISTGVTYNFTDTDAVYANVGYSWKKVSAVGQSATAPFNPNYGTLDGDKWNIAIGYKKAF